MLIQLTALPTMSPSAQTMGAGRRSRRSRTGCSQCKSKRIKCDETRPTCLRCVKAHLSCSLRQITPTGLIRPQLIPPVSTGLAGNAAARDEQTTTNECNKHPPPCFSIEEMLLLHHFTTATFSTLSDRRTCQEVWQTDVVKLTAKNDFLMHAILSMSALHVAKLRPAESERYSILAASNQGKALDQYRVLCQNIDATNCDALLACSILVAAYVPASAGTTINSQYYVGFLHDNLFDGVVDWLKLVRGIRNIIEAGERWLRRGVFANFFNTCNRIHSNLSEGTKSDVHDYKRQNERLIQLADLWQLGQSRSIDTPPDEAAVYNDTLSQLQDCFAHMDGRRTTYSRIVLAFRWLFMAPPRYFELLEMRRPIALIIFAHYAVLSRRLQAFWWAYPIPFKITTAVTAVLPSRYHDEIAWALQEVRKVDA